jgi:hypothetical protein
VGGLRLKLFFHDRCFDGTTSAALFGRFYRDVIARGARVVPVGLGHRDGDPFAGIAMDGDDHACVDFRYSPDPAMRWWFDHHRTAFQPPELRAVFDARRSDTHWFDPDAPSCAGLVARSIEARWGWTPPPALAEAVAWAEVIDAAAFATAADATSMAHPAQRLAAFLGAAPDDAAVIRYVDALGDGAALADLAAAPWVRDVVDRLAADRARAEERLAARADVRGDLVVVDLLDDLDVAAPGFLAYAMFPRCRYTVAATRGRGTIKIAVGYNPWSGLPRAHDVGALCQGLGGGGHAAVGGVTLRDDETARARAAIAVLAAALRTPR